MSFEFYRVVHICGLLLLFSGLAAMWGLAVAKAEITRGRRITISMIHGIGLLSMLVSGFAMAGQLNLASHPPAWLNTKLVIWLIMGASLGLARRKAKWGAALLLAWVVLGTFAAYLALFKPF
jgi:hypothetical protein